MAVSSAGPYANNLHLAPYNHTVHTNTSSLKFLQAGCSSWRPTNSVRALKARIRALGRIACIQCRCGLLLPWCSVVCLSVCWTQPWAVQKRMSRSKYGLRWAQLLKEPCNMCGPGSPKGKGQFYFFWGGGHLRTTVKYIGNIWREPKLFGRWQQRCLRAAFHCQYFTKPTGTVVYLPLP